jgi:hypothetical protein
VGGDPRGCIEEGGPLCVPFVHFGGIYCVLLPCKFIWGDLRCVRGFHEMQWLLARGFLQMQCVTGEGSRDATVTGEGFAPNAMRYW